jgi:hypothetical protein
MIVFASVGAVHRPGPQANNQIGTLSQQLALARTPRPGPRDRARARILELIGDDIDARVRTTLADELPAAVTYLTEHRGGRTDGRV